MRTKEPKNNTDYGMVSRLSIQRDFRNANFRRITAPAKVQPQQQQVKRVLALSDASNYGQYKKYIVGKLVRIVEKSATGNGYIVEFVNDNDRQILNGLAGWNNKRQYLLDGVKFD